MIFAITSFDSPPTTIVLPGTTRVVSFPRPERSINPEPPTPRPSPRVPRPPNPRAVPPPPTPPPRDPRPPTPRASTRPAPGFSPPIALLIPVPSPPGPRTLEASGDLPQAP